MDLYQVAEIEISYSRKIKTTDRPQVLNSKDAYHILYNNWEKNKLDFIEQAKILLLNRAGYALGICNVSTGSLAGTVVDMRLIFGTAIKANAASIILAHNHPSANLTPSKEDKHVTAKYKEAGNLLDIPVWDHFIITSEGYYSFEEDTGYERVQRGNEISLEILPPF